MPAVFGINKFFVCGKKNKKPWNNNTTDYGYFVLKKKLLWKNLETVDPFT